MCKEFANFGTSLYRCVSHYQIRNITLHILMLSLVCPPSFCVFRLTDQIKLVHNQTRMKVSSSLFNFSAKKFVFKYLFIHLFPFLYRYTYGGHVALKICPLYNVALSHIWSATFWKPLHICKKYYVEPHCCILLHKIVGLYTYVQYTEC
jgi:hypothetical protein